MQAKVSQTVVSILSYASSAKICKVVLTNTYEGIFKIETIFLMVSKSLCPPGGSEKESF